VDPRRAFPGGAWKDPDPFLLLDQMGPMDVAPGKAGGFPPHPHRGFETVTHLLGRD
jgi:redox-sensitive bicupin YhaK (pirin superfamily)